MGLTEFLISFAAVIQIILKYALDIVVIVLLIMIYPEYSPEGFFNYDLSYFKKEIGIKPADRHPGMVIKSWQDDFFSACM